MVSADHVGGGCSNLVEGVEFSLTPPPPENNWYAVPLQQPVRDRKEGINLVIERKAITQLLQHPTLFQHSTHIMRHVLE